MISYVRVFDRLPLPLTSADYPIIGSALREDQYVVHVSRVDEVALGHLLAEVAGRRIAVITDDTVAILHARRLAGQLTERGMDVALTSFPPGEASKSLRTASDLLDWLAGTSLGRRDIVLAVGGGVVIDTVGWVASAYMRGVPYINVPTTLLAHVDAALGGKVAVDHSSAKNLIGAFYQPKAVVSNVAYLSTLDARQIRAGLAEAIKKGVIASPELFNLIDTRSTEILDRDLDVLEELVRGASVIKCQLIARDPYEQDLRRPLNFGHTVGHAVETVTGYGPVLHGEAVAFGMVVASRIAETRGLLRAEVRERIVELLYRVGLPTGLSDFAVNLDIDDVVGALGQIRKVRDGKIRFVLPVELGETVITDDVTDQEIRSALLASDVDSLAQLRPLVKGSRVRLFNAGVSGAS
jgi:3-dehydroquinate synthase